MTRLSATIAPYIRGPLSNVLASCQPLLRTTLPSAAFLGSCRPDNSQDGRLCRLRGAGYLARRHAGGWVRMPHAVTVAVRDRGAGWATVMRVVADRTRAAVDGLLSAQPAAWLAHLHLVALDP
jgi:hypothetical protein